MYKKLLLLGFLIAGLGMAFTTTNEPTGYAVGDTAKDFKLKNVDGKMVSLKSMKKAKGYIVVFTCNHCPYALAYQDRIIELHNKYAELGYPVVAINPNDKDRSPGDSFDKMQERAKEKDYPFVYLYDEKQDVARSFGATRTPHVYILDKNMKVQYIGAIDDNSESAEDASEKYVENAVDALLKGESVAVTQTKAIGCTIKWKK
jgi:peroxiredoxin